MVGALPRKGRGWYEHSLHLGGLNQLGRAMPIWARGALLDPAAFHGTFFGPYDSRTASRLLQSAARETATAHPRMELGQPLKELTGAVQEVGIYSWPPFLARSAQRADEVLASDEPRIIRVGTLDVPLGLAAALGIAAVIGGLAMQGSRTGQGRSQTASPTHPPLCARTRRKAHSSRKRQARTRIPIRMKACGR